MRSSSLFAVLFLATLSAGASGCTAGGVDDGAESSEAEVRKRVKPIGGNGGFEYLKPAWSTTGASSRMTFKGAPIAFGAPVSVPPGNYAFTSQARSTEDGTFGAQQSTIRITAGNVETRTATGLRVRFDTPPTFGGVRFELSGAVKLDGFAPWRKSATGVTMILLPLASNWTSSANTGTTALTLVEGQLSEVVLPTARLEVEVDTIDPAYPSPATCPAPMIDAGGADARQTMNARREDGTALGPKIVPQGVRAPVTLRSYGFETKYPTIAGQTTKVVLNRLEVDDVLVDGVSVPGKYSLRMRSSSGEVLIACAQGGLPTHTGLDLPDGTYVVTSSASGITHQEVVTFP
jgi:hypothetical protein